MGERALRQSDPPGLLSLRGAMPCRQRVRLFMTGSSRTRHPAKPAAARRNRNPSYPSKKRKRQNGSAPLCLLLSTSCAKLGQEENTLSKQDYGKTTGPVSRTGAVRGTAHRGARHLHDAPIRCGWRRISERGAPAVDREKRCEIRRAGRERGVACARKKRRAEKKKSLDCSRLFFCITGAPSAIRTHDPCLRRAVLYPAELWALGRQDSTCCNGLRPCYQNL